jgi:hypothetical protein
MKGLRAVSVQGRLDCSLAVTATLLLGCREKSPSEPCEAFGLKRVYMALSFFLFVLTQVSISLSW